MATYITIDGGTTNTRIGLIKDYNLIDIIKFDVGAGMDKGTVLWTRGRFYRPEIGRQENRPPVLY